MGTNKSPYKLSRDYNKMFDLICKGFEVFCYVESVKVDGEIIKDPALCRRRGEWNIQIGVRGLSYLYIIPNFDTNKNSTEIDHFVLCCKQRGVEFVDVDVNNIV